MVTHFKYQEQDLHLGVFLPISRKFQIGCFPIKILINSDIWLTSSDKSSEGLIDSSAASVLLVEDFFREFTDWIELWFWFLTWLETLSVAFDSRLRVVIIGTSGRPKVGLLLIWVGVVCDLVLKLLPFKFESELG